MTQLATLPAPARAGSDRPWLPATLVLALGTFAMGTDSFVVAGILPQIASGLHASVAAAGQTVTVFALTYALAAPVLAGLTHAVPRRALMTAALVLFALANMGAALAPDLPVLLAARVLAALGAASFTPAASAAAVALAGAERRGRALSVILGGLAVGTVLGVPAGTALGQHAGWRASLVFIAAVTGCALILLRALLPALPTPPPVPMRERFAVLADRRIVAALAVTVVSAAGGIMVYTYIARVLAGAHLIGSSLTLALLVWGAGGSIGAFGSGWCGDRFGSRVTVAGALGGIVLALAGLGFAHHAALALPAMFVGGAACWSVTAPINHRLTGLAPAAPGVVISFNSSGVYLGQAFGALCGGLLLGHGLFGHAVGARELCVIGAAAVAATLVLHLATDRPH